MTTIPIPLDDYAGNINTFGAVSVGKPARGTFEYGYFYPFDSDWFKVQLTAGETYVFAMSKVAMSTFNNTELALHDASGQQLIVRAGLASNGATFEYTATTSGSYFVDARTAPYFYSIGGGAYQISVDLKPTGDDYAASTSSTGTGALGVEKNARHETVGDADWFAYTFEAGKAYALSPSASNAGLVELSVYDSNGAIVSTAGKVFTPTAGGKYFVAATAYQAGNYAFTVAQAVDDHGSDATTNSTLSQGGVVSATLNHIGDQDWFKVQLEADTFYTFELDLDQPGTGEAIKLLLQKPDGAATNAFFKTTNAEGKAVMMVRVATAGDYFANVSYGTYLGGEASEQYTLKWSATAVRDDAGDTDNNGKPATIGTPVTGELSGSLDRDVYQFTLLKGVTYNFKIDGADNTRISSELHDVAGTYFAYGFDAEMYGFTPSMDGIYTLNVIHRGNETERLNYTIQTAIPKDDYAANIGGAGKVVVGGSTKGSLLENGGDRDWIGVELDAGKTYWFTLANDGTPKGYGGASARLLDTQGNELSATYNYAYDGFNMPTIALTPQVSGTYYYEIAGYSHTSGGYTLTAAIGAPDDAGNRISEAVPLSANTTRNGTLEVASDLDFYAVSAGANSPLVVTLEAGGNAGAYNYVVRYFDAQGADLYATTYFISGGQHYALFDGAIKPAFVSVGAQGLPNGSTYKVKAFNYADDFAGQIGTTGIIAVNGSVNGNIEALGDRDFFKVHLVAGNKYVIDLYGAAGAGGTIDASNFDLLTLLHPNGYDVTAAQWRQTGEARLEVVATTTGDYFVSVGGTQGARSLGTYRVALNQLSGDIVAPTLGVGLPGATSTTASLYLGFSEQVQVDGSAFSIKDSTGQHILGNTQLSVSALHHQVTIDPLQFLQPGRSYTLEVAPGGVRDLAGNLYAGQNSWTFTTPAATPAPTSGNDMLVSAGKGAMVDGGAGIDTLVMPGARSEYQLFKLADGRVQVQPTSGAASEVLSNVERVFFKDQAVALDINGNGGQAFRLYKAAFDRMPDSVGVGYWTGQMDTGTSVKAIADAFITSPEFTNRYGTLTTNAEFVNLLYQNVLHRAGDSGGIEYWNNLLNQGYSRAETLLGFADSPENQSIVAGLIGVGFDYTPI